VSQKRPGTKGRDKGSISNEFRIQKNIRPNSTIKGRQSPGGEITGKVFASSFMERKGSREDFKKKTTKLNVGHRNKSFDSAQSFMKKRASN
jgi:hypothetical protein